MKWNKKAQSNDTPIIFGILLVIVACAIIIPIVVNDLDPDNVSDDYDLEPILEDVEEDANSITFLGALETIARIFVWNWQMPFYIEMYFILLRIIAYYIIIRLFRGVG